MNSNSSRSRLGILLGVLAFGMLAMPMATMAQATRTWVSGVGDDVNPCSRTAPCKTFAGAISKTAAGGEINVIDDGGYGAVTITKSITIDGHDHLSSILNTGTNGIIVNAAQSDKITLRDLRINGTGTGLNGIRILSGRMVIVDNVKIFGCTQAGISMENNHNLARLIVADSFIHNNGAGIKIQPSPTGALRATIRKTQIDDNRDGVIINTTGGGAAGAHIIGSAISDSGLDPNGTGFAVQANGANSTARLTDNEIQANRVGLQASAGGQILSFGDNAVFGNVTDGNPTGTLTKK